MIFYCSIWKMKIRSLLLLLVAIVSGFLVIPFISAFFLEGGGFPERFRSAFTVMATVGYGTPVSVPNYLGFILWITGLILGFGFVVVAALILLKILVRLLRSEWRNSQ